MPPGNAHDDCIVDINGRCLVNLQNSIERVIRARVLPVTFIEEEPDIVFWL